MRPPIDMYMYLIVVCTMDGNSSVCIDWVERGSTSPLTNKTYICITAAVSLVFYVTGQ